MRCLATITTAACVLSRIAQAVFIDDAGVVDWHQALLGYPRDDATFFHQPHQFSKASLVYTLSDRNVVAAVNPKDGIIVWRHQLQDKYNSPAFLRTGQTSETVVSGLGSEVVAWVAGDGRQAWSADLGESVIQDLEILELEDAVQTASEKDSLVLAKGNTATVTRLSGVDGHKIWEYVDTTGDQPHQVSASSTHVYYVSLHPTAIGGYSIRVTTLDPIDGHKIDQYTLSRSDITDASHILAVGANSASPIITWTDKDYRTLYINVIGAKSVDTFNVAHGSQKVEKITIHAPSRANSRPHFLVHYHTSEGSWAEVYHVDLQKSTVSKAYDLPKLAGHNAFTATSEGSNVYFTRVTEQEILVLSSASHGVLSRAQLKGFGAFEQAAYPVHVASELSVKGETVSAVRSTILLSTGNWALVRDGTVAWLRPEELAHTVAAAFAHIPSVDQEYQQEVSKESELDVFSAYAYRWTRHIHDLQKLPEFLSTLPDKLLSSVGVTEKTSLEVVAANGAFGFHKVVVCLTSTGYAIGIDAGEFGKTLWKSLLPAAVRPQQGQEPVLKAYADGTVEVQPSLDSVERYFLDSVTGAEVKRSTSSEQPQIAASLNIEGTEASLAASPALGATEPWWQFKAPPGEVILSTVARTPGEPIASIGRVLGDRRVLYKYLNPNLILVATGPVRRTGLNVHLFDSSTGETLYTVVHADVVPSQPFSAVVSENWFAYSYTEDSGEGGTRASVLVVGDLYKSSIPDDHGEANSTEGLYIPVQSYIIPEPISQMTVSQTGQGITSKELLVTLPLSNALVGIPRGIIDPRRPVGRDPSKTEQFEGLIRYIPMLEFDPKWYLTHHREVLGIKNVTTSPAVLESTSLVFAYGLDLFGTRVSPSFSFDILGKDFNKLQMLATVFALGIGTFVVAPLVQRKQVNTQWSFAS